MPDYKQASGRIWGQTLIVDKPEKILNHVIKTEWRYHMKYSGLLVILILTTATFGYSDDDKSVTNAMLLEKIDLYQRLNDTRFELIFNELKKLREDMNDRFELMREEMNTRFEQVDKRIEQVDKRIDFNQQLILFLLALTVATPIGIEVWRKKLKKKNEEKLQKDFDALAAIIMEFSRLDERIRSAIRTVKEQGIILPNNLSYA
ncbi:MAG: hypothetical protein OMM_00085 [Candidatus Magnetoglobus multicellularis str. Araruama]|uniref:Uncharacterized protein n=1 Tax=Candidatus Magnetoglobus multicellularis str. Araruama TaxID=890399 RepID=A0A1V1PI76_9BACT|nr:MAG: hypothetical protein OMM_00085 [Candidatus Magnetoglobus multicellularis str. Araruama]